MRFRRPKKHRPYHPPRVVRNDPGKRPAGAKDDWSGVILERDDPQDRRSPGTLYIYGPQGYLGAYRANENGFQGTTRGIPLGHYTLQPKKNSGANWPAGTPAITGPGQPPGKPRPGYLADAILLHPAGAPGLPDSRACITVNDEGFRRVMHVLNRHPENIIPLIIR